MAGDTPPGADRGKARVPVEGPAADGARADGEDIGGDPACWLDRVCAECGRFVDDAFAQVCLYCGTPRGLGV